MTQEDERNHPRRARRPRNRHPARGGRAADAPVVDLRLRRVRAEAQIRLHAFRQSRRATCSRTRSPISKAAPARSSRPRAWARSRWSHISSGPTSSPSSPHDCYGGTFRLFTALHERGELQVHFVDFGRCGRARARCRSRPALVWIETPSNPLLRIIDIARHRARGPQRQARSSSPTTPSCRRAGRSRCELGADIVVHSTTKYLNGHSDVVGGAVIAATPGAARAVSLVGQLHRASRARPSTAISRLRGLRTLHARLREHGENAAARGRDARRASGRSSACTYPGLPQHPGHELARSAAAGLRRHRQLRTAGGLDGVPAFLEALELFSLAESLGGVESLVAHPATMTHAAMAPEARGARRHRRWTAAAVDRYRGRWDLVRDLEQALAASR